MTVYNLSVDQMFVMLQGDSSNNPRGASASNTLSLSDFAQNYKRFYSAKNFFNVGQSVDGRQSIRNISVSDYLELHHSGHKSAGAFTIIDIFAISQYARVVEYEIIEHDLTITQSVVVIRVRGAAFSTITFTDSATVTLVRPRSLTQTLVIYSGGTCVVEDEDRYSITLPTLTGPNAPECS